MSVIAIRMYLNSCSPGGAKKKRILENKKEESRRRDEEKDTEYKNLMLGKKVSVFSVGWDIKGNHWKGEEQDI